eukprot:GHVU01116782.1.p1 GENE.GHVU01116782.1~~GHVU01116782.1.p1  ORF type:complete len:400 (+),score=34.43 GHVU01116782.1:173-1372(+)
MMGEQAWRGMEVLSVAARHAEVVADWAPLAALRRIDINRVETPIPQWSQLGAESGSSFSRLESVKLSGSCAVRCFASICGQCAPVLVELSLTQRNGEGATSFQAVPLPQLRSLELNGRVALETTSLLRRCVLRKLSLHQDMGDSGSLSLPRDFGSLEVLSFDGREAGQRFPRIAEACAATLKVLEVNTFGQRFVEEGLRGSYCCLEKLSLAGNGAASCFRSMAASCASSLLTLTVRDLVGTFEGVEGQFSNLTEVYFEGRKGGRCFASMSGSCAGSLRELTVLENTRGAGFEGSLTCEFASLQKVVLKGAGSSLYFGPVAQSCVATLSHLVMWEEEGSFVGSLPADFTRLRRVDLRGLAATAFFAPLRESENSKTIKKLTLKDADKRHYLPCSDAEEED